MSVPDFEGALADLFELKVQRLGEVVEMIEARRAQRDMAILRAVAIETRFSIAELRSKVKTRELCAARYLLFWRLRKAGRSTTEIGAAVQPPDEGPRSFVVFLRDLAQGETEQLAESVRSVAIPGVTIPAPAKDDNKEGGAGPAGGEPRAPTPPHGGGA